ncbi:MAG: transglutaminase domain-containing protein, partial [Myxococcota bacterium]|nr:transglutaminase domain-containing protein [Myxococcota bacterium]
RGFEEGGWEAPIGERITPEDATPYYEKLMRRQGEAPLSTGVGDPPPHGEGAVDPATLPEVLPETTPELEELARGLGYDPLAIYNYVHDNIDYEPYFGQRRGPTLTLLDGVGNDFDTAALLVSLLRISGHESKYVYGRMTIPLEEVANWLGVEPTLSRVNAMLDSAGIPFTYVGVRYTLNRVWVWLIVDGENVQLDPAMKRHEPLPNIDLGELLGYDRETLLSEIQVGATVTDTSIQHLNDEALRARLNGYSTNLVNALREQFPTADVESVMGGQRLIPDKLEALPETLAFSASPDLVLAEIPTAFNDTFRVQGAGIDHTFRTFEIGSRRLTISFSPGELRPEVRLNGELIAQGDPLSDNEFAPFDFYYDHPLAADEGGYLDSSTPKSFQAGADHIYAIVNGLSTSNRPIERAQKRLSRAKADGVADDSETASGEGLNIVGLTYARQVNLQMRLVARMLGLKTTLAHNFGFVSQTESVVIDWKAISIPTVALRDDVGLDDYFAWSRLSFGVGSALEHATLEQMHGTDTPGMSSVRALHLQNERGGRVLFMRADTLGDYLDSLSTTYSSSTIENFQEGVDEGGFVLAPENGQLVLNEWSGYGYLQSSSSAAGGCYCINGGLNGGHSSKPGPVPLDSVQAWQDTNTVDLQEFQSPTVPNAQSVDPIDLQTGFFLFNGSDAFAGSNLAMTRSYNSGRVEQDRGMGAGWRHNLEGSVTRTTRAFTQLGTRTLVDLAPLIVLTHVGQDIIRELVGCPTVHYCGEPKQDALGHMVVALTQKWFTDQLTENAVVLEFGGSQHEFIELPDGTFSAAPGVTTELFVHEDETVSAIERNGPEVIFDANDRLVQIADVDGNLTNYLYDASGRLSQVVDPFEHSLTLAYEGDHLAQVTDSTGNVVSYTYSDGDLTAVTDVAGQVWSYGYDSDHNLVTLTDPLGRVTATNTYDDLHRVVTQVTPRQEGEATYNFFWTEFRTVEEGPGERRTTYFYDRKGRLDAVQDALGAIKQKRYDGQNHVTEGIDALGQIWSTEYNGDH